MSCFWYVEKRGLLRFFSVLSLSAWVPAQAHASDLDALLDEIEQSMESHHQFRSPGKVAGRSPQKDRENRIEFEGKDIYGRNPEENLLLEIGSELAELEASLEDLSDQVNSYRFSLLQNSQVSNHVDLYVILNEAKNPERIQAFIDEILIYNSSYPYLTPTGQKSVLVYSGPIFPGVHKVRVVQKQKSVLSSLSDKSERTDLEKRASIEVPEGSFRKSFSIKL